ncbi:glycoside hydrolase family 32 protein [Carnobacterium sp. TMP28]|uniref:glycoside hydrolase family 32 protein n=1 Tax=Carnobacterium sp. TMP28 TaxID=3397060 RepID=UPI0039E157BD
MAQNKTMGKYELGYHITPAKGLLNDPNGLIQFNGVYHVFYQWNQSGTTHTTKSWGHVISDDLIHWVDQPVALEPDEWFDKDGCYSGSAVAFEDKLYLFYTGNVRNEKNERESYQCLAVSKDGLHFEKKGPIIAQPSGYTAHVRDPKVWQNEDNTWWMVLGAQKKDLTGDTLIYHSKDLMDWTFKGSLMDQIEDMGFMWECPDLIQFEEKFAFIFSPQGLTARGDEFKNIYQSGYLTGDFSKAGKFLPDDQPFKELDRGFEFYAPQTFQDSKGRYILFGWMGVMEPEVEAAVPTVQDGWIHNLTIPREVDYKKGQLIQRPVAELKKLRQNQPQVFIGKTKESLQLSTLQNELLFNWKEAAGSFAFQIRNEVLIEYDQDSRRIQLTRTNWLTKKRESRAVTLKHPLTQMQGFLESSTLELFINDGEEVFSLRYFQSQEVKTVTVSFCETGKEPEITLYSLKH